MKSSSCKNYKCSSCMLWLFACLLLSAGIIALSAMWCRTTGKTINFLGVALSPNTLPKSSGKPLVIAEKGGRKVIATIDDFKDMLLVLERSEPGMQFIASLPETEQTKIYLGIINDYLITSYLIKEYMSDTGIDKTEDFKRDYAQFVNVMAGTFYLGLFQKKINESIIVNEEEARAYYENARFEVPEFMSTPFALQIPGIEARAVRIETGKDSSDYATRLKQNKDVMSLGRVNRSIRGMSTRILDALGSMKDGEVRKVELENNISFAIYRVAQHPGEWAKFDDVSDKVMQIMRIKLLETRCKEILEKLRKKAEIVINDDLIQKMIQDKKSAQNVLTEEIADLMDEEEAEDTATSITQKVA